MAEKTTPSSHLLAETSKNKQKLSKPAKPANNK
jgi:hypothetical protein